MKFIRCKHSDFWFFIRTNMKKKFENNSSRDVRACVCVCVWVWLSEWVSNISRQGKKCFLSSSKCPDQVWGYPFSYSVDIGVCLLVCSGVKWPLGEADRSRSSSAEGNQVWSLESIPAARLHGTCRTQLCLQVPDTFCLVNLQSVSRSREVFQIVGATRKFQTAGRWCRENSLLRTHKYYAPSSYKVQLPLRPGTRKFF